jgi:hypothetical protein
MFVEMMMNIVRNAEVSDTTGDAMRCEADLIKLSNRKTYGKQEEEVSWRLLVQFLSRPNNKQIRLRRKYRNFINGAKYSFRRANDW